MTDRQWTEQANAIAARYEHGHPTLTNDCSLCNAEYDEVHAITHPKPTPVTDDQELTRDEAIALADDLGNQLYRAEDRIGFVREMLAGRTEPVEPATVLAWLDHQHCARVESEQQQIARLTARVAELEAELAADRDAALHAPQLRHCIYPACLREFDAMATMSGRTPERESWSGEGWLQMTAVVGYICPDHAHLVAADAHRPQWTRPDGQEHPAVLRCACDWASPPTNWPRYGVAAWQNHLTELGEQHR